MRPVPLSPQASTRWFYWPGGFLGAGDGPAVPIAMHAHHAFQIMVAASEPLGVTVPDAGPHRYLAAIIRPNVPHAYAPRTGFHIVLLVDPESRIGRHCALVYQQPIESLTASRVPAAQDAVRAFRDSARDANDAHALVVALVEQFCLHLKPAPVDARIAAALEYARALDPRFTRAADVASRVHLSTSRFAHLFSEQVGLSFGRYLLWRRVTRAVLLASGGESLSHAAHAAGFADAAHFTRTFVKMFGIAPSERMRDGLVFQIRSPFEGLAPTDPEPV